MLFTIFAISLTSAPGIATITTITTVPIVAAATSVRPCITTGATVLTGAGARGLVGGGEVERAVAGGHLQYNGAVHSTLYSTVVQYTVQYSTVQQYLGVVQPQEVLLILKTSPRHLAPLLQPQLTRQPPRLHKSASQNVSWVLLSHLFRGD